MQMSQGNPKHTSHTQFWHCPGWTQWPLVSGSIWLYEVERKTLEIVLLEHLKILSSMFVFKTSILMTTANMESQEVRCPLSQSLPCALWRAAGALPLAGRESDRERGPQSLQPPPGGAVARPGLCKRGKHRAENCLL
jgi:hypothetical protein